MAEKPMTLAEGAERFDRLARQLKDSQRSETRGKPLQPPKPHLTEAFVQSPDEAWAKQYMTQCIGPVCFTQTAEGPGFVTFPATPPETGARMSAIGPAAKAAEPARTPAPAAEPIGKAIGKPVRRPFFARLFSRP